MKVVAVINKVEIRVRQFIEDIQHPQQKKKLNVNVLESQLRIHIEDYFDMDGYTLFHDVIERLVEENVLIPILNKQTNGRHPALPLFYWVNIKKEITKWDRLEMLKLNDRFDFSYYENHPEWQTEDEWSRVKNLYTFLKSSQDRQVVSLEERSLELFGHEKFLTDTDLFPDGKGFLQRIGVTMEELKCMKFGEPFVFWLKPGVQIAEIKRVLIVENLSFFHTCVQLLEEEVLDYEPELIIYGEGKKIERSFSFFFKLFPKGSYLFYYAGDLDAEGYSICMRLIDKYQECTIQPALKIYRKMLACMDQANSETGQVRNELQRERFFSWFTEEEQNNLNQLWAANNRIPQEVLTIETWRRWM